MWCSQEIPHLGLVIVYKVLDLSYINSCSLLHIKWWLIFSLQSKCGFHDLHSCPMLEWQLQTAKQYLKSSWQQLSSISWRHCKTVWELRQIWQLFLRLVSSLLTSMNKVKYEEVPTYPGTDSLVNLWRISTVDEKENGLFGPPSAVAKAGVGHQVPRFWAAKTI